MRLVLLLLMLAWGADEAAAQNSTLCGKREGVVSRLINSYGEHRKGAGLSGEAVFELYLNTATRGWTILATGTNGVTCVVAAGTHWERAATVEDVPGQPL